MPIILENAQDMADATLIAGNISHEVDPKYFSKSLTGNGVRKTGFLNKDFVPAKIDEPALASPYSCHSTKATFYDGTASYELLPMNIADYDMIGSFMISNLPNSAECISLDTASDINKVYAYTFMHNMVIKTVPSPSGKGNIRTAYMTYEVWLIRATNTNNQYEVESILYRALDANKVLNSSKYAKLIDPTKLIMYFDTFTVHDLVCESAEIWQHHEVECIKNLVENNVASNYIICACRNLNNYQVSLADYKAIYDYLVANKPTIIDSVTEVNLNLLLNKLLDTVYLNIVNAKQFNSVPGWYPKDIMLSIEQYNAVTSHFPYNMIQAGAGTGKSTAIRYRLDYMKACGVDMSKVLVLSYTNAAADHIKDIAPDVNSMTIAKLINDIYELNFPTHNLSTIDTIINLLEFNKRASSNPLKDQFVMYLKTLKKDINSGILGLSYLVHNCYNDVIAMLNAIGQTTFELQTIICYYAQNLKEPNSICEHVIMDEVQDNSIFEFIYILNYIVRHNSSLYLVGDGAQTLYEFRASNPKALNSLEMSGVFKCFQLQTNYRSNQNILDFANLYLSNIEANQFAKIQLHSNNLLREPFKEQVNVSYTRLMNRTKGLKEHCFQMLYAIKPWIDECLAKHEQVAFLSYRRSDLQLFKDFVESVYPQESYINIVPDKCYANSFFSTYIRYFGDDYMHNIGADATTEIMRHIIGNIDRIVYRDFQKDILKQYVSEWADRNRGFAMTMDSMLQAGMISTEKFKEDIFQKLIDFEVEKNALKQSLVSSRNAKMKNKDISSFKFIACTIHSAKGLEFDNVILLYDEAKRSEEESKRMYYVGMTRAKKSEYILAYNTEMNSTIDENYNAMKELDMKRRAITSSLLPSANVA